MRITDVQSLGPAHGKRVVPPLGGYDETSSGWTETEYHGRLVGTESIAGYWEGEPGWVRIDVWPYNEICVILEGRVAIVDRHGESRTYGPGEAFLVPAGFSGIWQTIESTKKIFVGVIPTAS